MSKCFVAGLSYMSLPGANVCFWYHYALQWCNILTRYAQWTLTNDLVPSGSVGRAFGLPTRSLRRAIIASIGASIAPDVLERALKKGEWNDYRIRAEGPHIQLWLNGVQTVDYTEAEPNIAARGHFGEG